MKKVFVILTVASIFLTSGKILAQNTLKLGHIDSRLVFAAMPESDSASKQLQREADAMQKTLEDLQAELQKKYQDYQKLANDPNTSQLILKTKEDELQSLQQRIETFQQNAEQSLSEKRAQLFKPIQDKAVKAVSDVAAENGFTYVFDIAGGSVVYSSPDSQDILPLVKAKLGIK
jgi:outer membrane protein